MWSKGTLQRIYSKNWPISLLFLSLRRQFPPDEMQPPPSPIPACSTYSLSTPTTTEKARIKPRMSPYFSPPRTTAAPPPSPASSTAPPPSTQTPPTPTTTVPGWTICLERAALVRTVLRSRDWDSGEEKCVRHSEVVEKKVKEEEVTSSAVDPRPAAAQRVSLKLDYDEIINAWFKFSTPRT